MDDVNDQQDEAQNREIERLIQALASDDLNTCLKAADDLARLSPPAIDPLINALRSPKTGFGAIQALANIGLPAIPPLLQLFSDSSVDAFAAEALKKLGVVAVPALIDALNHPDASVRCWSAEVLGWIGDPRAIEPLKTALDDEDADVRTSIARALREMSTHT